MTPNSQEAGQQPHRWGLRVTGTPALTKVTAGALVVLLLVFFLVTMVNLNTVRETVGTLNANSYTVTVAAGELETSLVQLGTLAERLTYVRTPEAIGVVEAEYSSIDRKLQAPLAVITERYLLSDGGSVSLASLYQNLVSEQQQLIDLCRNPQATDDEVRLLVKSRIEPLVSTILQRNTSIIGGARESFTSLYDLATSVCVSTISFAAVLLVVVLVALVIFLAAIRKKTTQQERLQSDLEIALEAARYASRAKSQFLASMSHDIRTPCSAIVGLADIAQRHAEDPERVRECLSKITLSSHHLINLINDVLDMSKIESGQLVLDNVPFSLKELVSFVDAISQPQAKSKRLTLDMTDCHIEHELLRGDSLRVRQVLLNLVSNAIKYTEPGGHVWLRVTRTNNVQQTEDSDVQASLANTPEGLVEKVGEQAEPPVAWYRFEVEDDGLGMTAEFVEHIFEPFERERTEDTRLIEGTGLGMAITKNIVDQMGGLILVHSENHRGTTIVVGLPFAPERQDAASIAEKDQVAASWRVDFSTARVLLAEDNDINAEIACDIIGRTQAEVVRVCDGQEAVDAVLAAPPGYFDLVFMDVQMPHLDGLEACRALHERCPSQGKTCPPVVAMTANAYVEDRQRATEAGMDDYIVKPVTFSELCRVLDKHVSA